MTKKGRRAEGLCLAEGRKLIDDIRDLVEFTVEPEDTPYFNDFVDTQTSQNVLAVVRIPQFNEADVFARPVVVVLDHVQDPGNVGAFMRLALGFGAGLVLRECADPFSPKVIRSSAGASFQVPHIECGSERAQELVRNSGRNVLKFEKTEGAVPFDDNVRDALLIFGNEGRGILSEFAGISVFIDHDPALESLSVSHAGAIALHAMHRGAK